MQSKQRLLSKDLNYQSLWFYSLLLRVKCPMYGAMHQKKKRSRTKKKNSLARLVGIIQ
jgi:hypothetical protein